MSEVFISYARSPVPHFTASIASLYGHLGVAREARQALADYHAASATPFEEVARNRFHRAEDRALFLEGIALAETLSDGRDRPRTDVEG